jgi:hypothetical protein
MVSQITRHTTLRIIREYQMKKREGESSPLSQGVQNGRQALGILCIRGVGGA